MPVRDRTRAHPQALAKSSYRHVCAPACTHQRVTRAPARTTAPACTYRRRATNVYAPARTATPAPARTRPHSPARIYPPPALLYGEAHDPRAGFSTHAPAPTAVPPPPPPMPGPYKTRTARPLAPIPAPAQARGVPGCAARPPLHEPAPEHARPGPARPPLHARPAQPARWRGYQHRRKRAARPDAPLVRPCTSQHRSMRARAPLVRLRTHGPHNPHAGADTSTGASARHARMRRSSALARASTGACAPGPRLRTHGPHDPHAGAGTSTGACAPVCAARPHLRTRAARTHISVHGATARIMAELPCGRWHAQLGRGRAVRGAEYGARCTKHIHWAVGGGEASGGALWQRAVARAVAADGAHACWT
ncbi:hypothetical protein GGX14DRAFT_587785 [Mycena pura]|uniref:Uncharacterized protein n=1 Tax=Mycena pura TaxID=153505 RepID=A0AAD6UUD6_9AGAR|nr:hypothetical protein GGX14DRAFT_587785 [Mycena pura]